MPCKIYLRCGQSILDRSNFLSKNTTIFAPMWVKEGLLILGQLLEGVTFELYDGSTRQANTFSENIPIESIKINEDFNNQSLKLLQRIARNESCNTSGIINTGLYSDINDLKLLYSIKDLVRQCVIAGIDEATGCGGYKCAHERQDRQKVYICDLAALQFQQPYNTGRLVLVQKEDRYVGILDDLIYGNVVGESKKGFEEVSKSWENDNAETRSRYLKHDGYGLSSGNTCFVDTTAYRKFVASDVVLCGLAFSEVAFRNGDKVNFKFLKYGTGFFAGCFANVLDSLILSGVLDGLERLFEKRSAKVLSTIKSVELPFYESDPKSIKRIHDLEKKYGIKVLFGINDALKQTCKTQGLVIATTNCGDTHAACGNEMAYGSVDAAISENLASKGNYFCPNINLLMKEKFVDFLSSAL